MHVKYWFSWPWQRNGLHRYFLGQFDSLPNVLLKIRAFFNSWCVCCVYSHFLQRSVRLACPDEAELAYAPLLVALDDGSRWGI